MSEQQFSIGAYYEAQAFKGYLESLSDEELKKVAYELFVHLQNSRALNTFWKAECNRLTVQSQGCFAIEELG